MKSEQPNWAGPQFAAMKMDKPKPVRWCSARSTPIRVRTRMRKVDPEISRDQPLGAVDRDVDHEVDEGHEPEFRRHDQDQRQRNRKVNQAMHQKRQGPAVLLVLAVRHRAVCRTKSAMMCLKVSSNIQPMSASTGTADDMGGNDKADALIEVTRKIGAFSATSSWTGQIAGTSDL